MYISNVKIKGFRNFFDEDINFNKKCLIVGQNDVGKTNLIYALRLLLDRNLTINEIEPQESDFSIFLTGSQKEFIILVSFKEINVNDNQKVLSKLKGYISENGELYLMYRAFYQNEILKYELKIGHSIDLMESIDGRDKYISCISIAFLNSSRDLEKYVNRSKDKLLERVASLRNEQNIKKDEDILVVAEQDLHKLNKSLEELTYIANSTNMINQSIKEMGSHNFPHNIKFGLKNDIRALTKTLDLISEINDRTIPTFGGDGRNNQIYLSMWQDETENKKKENDSTLFYFIEEPETHLHPNFQLSTMKFLFKRINDQIVVTTHSPSIASSVLPSNIVRLYFDKHGKTRVSNNGCSQNIGEAIYNLGYRLNVINSEIYFARGVVLVEGISEKILFEELSRQLKVDLNRENIIIISVEGVGFDVYIKILDILQIPYVMRTDLDIFKKAKKNEYYSSGINRIAELVGDRIVNFSRYKKYYYNIPTKLLPKANQYFINKCRRELSEFGYYLAYKDLETDLVESEIFPDLKQYFDLEDKEEIIVQMQQKKATFMYNFIKDTNVDLTKIKCDGFSELIYMIKHKVKWYKNGR